VRLFGHSGGTLREIDDLRRGLTVDRRRHSRRSCRGSRDCKSASVCGYRCLASRGNEIVESLWPEQDAYGRDANSRTASIVISSNPIGITTPMEFPERPDTRVHALAARE
jgi:hypothetical protein